MNKILFVALLLTSVLVQAQTVSLAWDPVTNDSRVTGYEVHYGIETGNYGAMEIVDGAATDEYTVRDLDAGSTYFFAVRSKNIDGSLVSAFSNEVSTGPNIDLTAPGPLRIVTVSTRTVTRSTVRITVPESKK